MNFSSAIPKSTKLIKQVKNLIDEFKAIKYGIERIHDFYYDPDYKDSKELRCYKTSLNKVIYIVNNELDDIKVELDSLLEDMECKEHEDWKEWED